MSVAIAQPVATNRQHAAGHAVLHPIAVIALCLLVLNDHLFKAHYPGLLTGKLSDFAGLVVCPVFFVTCFERIQREFASPRVVAAICVLTAIAFALTKTWSPATEAYRVVWATLRWPLDAVVALTHHERTRGIGRVAAVRDPSDLVALPAVLVAWLVCNRRDAKNDTRPR